MELQHLNVELPCSGGEVLHSLFSAAQAKEEKAKSQ
jgi:hypothetical protein